MLKLHFVTNSWPDINKKLQKMENQKDKPIEELLREAQKVYIRKYEEKQKQKAKILLSTIQQSTQGAEPIKNLDPPLSRQYKGYERVKPGDSKVEKKNLEERKRLTEQRQKERGKGGVRERVRGREKGKEGVSVKEKERGRGREKEQKQIFQIKSKSLRKKMSQMGKRTKVIYKSKSANIKFLFIPEAGTNLLEI